MFQSCVCSPVLVFTLSLFQALHVLTSCAVRSLPETNYLSECLLICRVHSIGHSSNTIFPECRHRNTRQKLGFAECRQHSTRQTTIEHSANKKHTVNYSHVPATCDDGRQAHRRPLVLCRRVFCGNTRQGFSFAE